MRPSDHPVSALPTPILAGPGSPRLPWAGETRRVVRWAKSGARCSDSPVAALCVAVPVSTLFVVLRWLDAARRRLGAFVVAGRLYADPAQVPRGLPVQSVNGYDGQFYYRLGLDPFDLARTAFGIRLDSFSRVERIGYPFLAWMVSGGQHAWLPLALVVVNVAACGLVALAGGLLAQSAGRHALWGLVFAGFWGYLWTLGRDLTELTAAAFVLLGLAAFVRRAPIWSGLAFLCAVVSKETSVLLVATLALVALWRRFRPAPDACATTEHAGTPGQLRPRRADAVFIIPLVGFVLWQLVLLLATGKVPIYKSGGENLGVPLVGLFSGFSHYFSLFPQTAAVLWMAELGVLILVTIGAALSFRAAPIEFRALWIASVLLALSTAKGIWLGDVGFRSLDDAYLTGWLVLFYRRPTLSPWAWVCAGHMAGGLRRAGPFHLTSVFDAAAPSASLERVDEDLDGLGGLLPRHAHGGGDAQDVSVQSPQTDQQALAATYLEHLPCRRSIRHDGAWLDELDADHESPSPYLGHHAESGRAGLELVEEEAAHLEGVALKVVAEQIVQIGERPGGGQRIAAEGGDRVGADRVDEVAPTDDTTDGQTVPQALGEGHQIGHEAVRLETPEVVAGAPPAGLHLIGDEEDAVLVEHFLHGCEEPVGRDDEAPDALDRLGDQARHVAGRGRLDHLAQVPHAGPR